MGHLPGWACAGETAASRGRPGPGGTGRRLPQQNRGQGQGCRAGWATGHCRRLRPHIRDHLVWHKGSPEASGGKRGCMSSFSHRPAFHPCAPNLAVFPNLGQGRSGHEAADSSSQTPRDSTAWPRRSRDLSRPVSWQPTPAGERPHTELGDPRQPVSLATRRGAWGRQPSPGGGRGPAVHAHACRTADPCAGSLCRGTGFGGPAAQHPVTRAGEGQRGAEGHVDSDCEAHTEWFKSPFLTGGP